MLPHLGLVAQTLPPKVLPSAWPLCGAELCLGSALTEEAPRSRPGCPECTGSAVPRKHFSKALPWWEGWYPTNTGLSLSCFPRHRQVHRERGPVFLLVALGHPQRQRGDGGLCDRCFHRGESLELGWAGVSLCLLPLLSLALKREPSAALGLLPWHGAENTLMSPKNQGSSFSVAHLPSGAVGASLKPTSGACR